MLLDFLGRFKDDLEYAAVFDSRGKFESGRHMQDGVDLGATEEVCEYLHGVSVADLDGQHQGRVPTLV